MSESGSESSSSESNNEDRSGAASPEGSSYSGSPKSTGGKSPNSNASSGSRSPGSAPGSPNSQNSEHSPKPARRLSRLAPASPQSSIGSPNAASEALNKGPTSPPATPISTHSLTPVSDRSGEPGSPHSNASCPASPESRNSCEKRTSRQASRSLSPKSPTSQCLQKPHAQNKHGKTKQQSSDLDSDADESSYLPRSQNASSPTEDAPLNLGTDSPTPRNNTSRESLSKSPERLPKKGKSILSPMSRRRGSCDYDDNELHDYDNIDTSPSKNTNMPHDDDLSDVSDLDNMEDESQEATDFQEINKDAHAKRSEQKISSLEEEHEHLDFEADGQWRDDKDDEEKDMVKSKDDDKNKMKGDDNEDEKLDADDQSFKINGGENDVVSGKKDASNSKKEYEALDGKDREDPKGSDLEEGELSDGEEGRPEESEPRPVCRFFSRGQCTWGVSCRFLHPGVTDKGNYTMFDVVRPVNYPGHGPVPNPHEFRPHIERPPLMRGPPPFLTGPPKIEDPSESAWERGLRHAKEMMRKANKRKELDMNFEEKKMNLSLGQDDIDREAEYYVRPGSPEPPLERWPPVDRRRLRATPDYIEESDAYYQSDYYRKLPYKDGRAIPDYHDRPDYHNMFSRGASHHSVGSPPMSERDYYGRSKYERKHKHPTREVIIERIPSSKYREEDGSFERGQGDEWTDSWMRRKSPAGRHGIPRRSRKQSYSSGSSYSSSSSSRSSSRSSYSSYDSGSKSRSFSRSPRSKNSKKVPITPPPSCSTTQRGSVMNPPAPTPRTPKKSMSPQCSLRSRLNPALSPMGTQKQRDKQARDKAASAAAAAVAKVIKSQSRSRSSGSSSGSDSSGSSSDTSESSYSSSSSGDKNQKVSTPPLPSKDHAKAMDSAKPQNTRQLIKLTLKQPAFPPVKKIDRSATIAGKKRPAESMSEAKSNATAAAKAAKKTSSRRDELLKQLKAVEDAIARKSSVKKPTF